MKRYALAATLTLLLGGAVQAATIDLNSLQPGQRTAELSTGARVDTGLSVSMSELPEPEVFAMMLVGLILIGYRASRDSSEKFDNGIDNSADNSAKLDGSDKSK